MEGGGSGWSERPGARRSRLRPREIAARRLGDVRHVQARQSTGARLRAGLPPAQHHPGGGVVGDAERAAGRSRLPVLNSGAESSEREHDGLVSAAK